MSNYMSNKSIFIIHAYKEIRRWVLVMKPLSGNLLGILEGI